MSTPRLAVVDVGHGNCATLHTSDGVVVIDAGPKNALLEYLSQESVREVDLVLLSHSDEDHIAGLIALISSKEIRIKCVRLNTDSNKKSKLWDDLAYELKQSDIDNRALLQADDNWTFENGRVEVRVVAPSSYLALRGPGSKDRSGRLITSNTISACVLISCDGEGYALFPGDLDIVGLQNLKDDWPSQSVFLLAYPHHGGRSRAKNEADFAREICDHVDPTVVIFSIGRNRAGFPRSDVVSAIRGARPDTWVVCTQLAEQCATELPAENPDHLNEAFALGRGRRQCCGGTLVFALPPADHSQMSSAHQEFVQLAASSPLCRRVHH